MDEIRYRSITALRYNALGLASVGWLGYQRHLYPEARSPLLQNCSLELGVVPGVSPAGVSGGVGVTVTPLAVLVLSSVYERYQWFGNYTSLHYLSGVQQPYGEQDRLQWEQEGSYRASGYNQWRNAVTLQAKVGPVAVRTKGSAVLIHQAELRAGERSFYDPGLDIPAAVDSWTLRTDSDLLYLGAPGWVLGLRHTWQRPLYLERHMDPEMPGGLDPTQHLLGPLVAWDVWSEEHDGLRGTAFLMSQWFVRHPYRATRPGDQALPQIVAGWSMQGSLLSW